MCIKYKYFEIETVVFGQFEHDDIFSNYVNSMPLAFASKLLYCLSLEKRIHAI